VSVIERGAKKEKRTQTNIRILMPLDYELTSEVEVVLERSASEIEDVTGEEIYLICVNEDHQNPGRIYDYKFVIRRRV